jgi:hypothetical protein
VSPLLVVRPADPLDLHEARRLVAELEVLPPGANVHLDLAAAREVHPAALALVARAAEGHGRVTLGGLSRRQERLLAYLVGDAHDRRRPLVATALSTSTSTCGA